MTFYRRRLPHWFPPGHDVFLAWRLHGSFPRRVSHPKENASAGEKFAHYDRILDRARTGPLWLSDSRIAELLLASLREGLEKKQFELRAYVLMANHIHILLNPLTPVEEITQAVKGTTARKANRILARTGQRFWQDESFDRWVRNPAEGEKIRRYIERNPVAAGLVTRPEDWPWSSASHQLP